MLEVDNESKSSGYRIIYNNHLSQHSDYGDSISRAINYAVSKKKMVVVALNVFPSVGTSLDVAYGSTSAKLNQILLTVPIADRKYVVVNVFNEAGLFDSTRSRNNCVAPPSPIIKHLDLVKNGSENTQSASSSDAYLNTIVRLTSIVRGNISRDFKFIFSDAGMLESKSSSWCNEWNSIGLESINNTISRYDSVLSKLLQPASPLIDYIGLNYYPDLVSTANNIVTIADNLTAKYNKPIIITETGMNTTDENTKKTIMKAEFAALTLVPNIPMVFVHYDIGGVYGVKNNDRTPRPAYSEIPRSVDIRVSTKPSWCNVTYTDISTRLPVCDILENL